MADMPRSRKAPTRAERRVKTREALIDAAGRLFVREGFHATSLDAIADEAGYTKGAVYSNFDGKEDLFFALYERRVERRVHELEEAITSAPSASEALTAIETDIRNRPDDGWLAVFFEFWAHVLRHPEHRERFATLRRRVLRPPVEALEALAIEQEIELPTAPELIATAYFALGNGLQIERLTRPDGLDLDAIAGFMGPRIITAVDPGAA